jgi:prophage tail gpP-like protein
MAEKDPQAESPIEEVVEEVNVVGQNFGNNQHYSDDASDIKVTVKNPNYTTGPLKPLTLMSEMPGNKIFFAMRANHEDAKYNGSAVQVFITVQGWLCDDGSLWIEHLGKDCSIYSPMIFPTNTATLAIKGVTHKQSSEAGTTTTIELCLPSALSSENQPVHTSSPVGGP